MLEQARHSPEGAPPLELDQAERFFNVFKRHHEALRHYVPPPLRGPRPAPQGHHPPDPAALADDLGWSTWLTGKLVVHQVPGNHYTLLRTPHVALLAERLAHDLNTLDQPEAA